MLLAAGEFAGITIHELPDFDDAGSAADRDIDFFGAEMAFRLLDFAIPEELALIREGEALVEAFLFGFLRRFFEGERGILGFGRGIRFRFEMERIDRFGFFPGKV